MGRKGKETSIELRKLIISHYQNGKSLQDISNIVKRSRSTIQSIIKRFKTENRIENKRRNANRKLLTDREERFILREINVNPKTSAPKLTTRLKNVTGKNVSVDTVRRVLRRHEYHGRVARKKPFVSKVNKEKRLNFAKQYGNCQNDFWNRVLFTDESKFNVFQSDGRQLVWRKPNTSLDQKNLQATVKYGGGSLMVWGCFSAAGVGSLHFIEGIMDKIMYINILKEHVRQSVDRLGIGNNFIFYQDNDPKHKARITHEWLLYNCPTVLDTPPQLPDLNPIENLWSELKRRVAKYEIKNKQELRNKLELEWANISPDITQQLVESMPNRLAEVIRRRGYPTKY